MSNEKDKAALEFIRGVAEKDKAALEFINELVTESDDPVNHPGHYTAHPSGVECIDITEHYCFNLGNAIKYIWRADLKHDNALEDLKKASWYLEREISLREAELAPDMPATTAVYIGRVNLADLSYVCAGCAEQLGGNWPEGHIATHHAGKCDCCHKQESLASVGDYDWPDGKKRGMRD